MLLLLALQTLYTDHGNPTPAEQRILEIINRARLAPDAEAVRLNIDPTGLKMGEGLTAAEQADIGARPPLAMNGKLLGTARAHSLDMYTRAFFSHVNPDGLGPGNRILAAGYSYFGAAENIAMRTGGTAEQLGDDLMIDFNYAGRGHRTTLLDIDDGSSTTYYREIGIGYYSAPAGVLMPARHPTALWKEFLTENFGHRATQPFLLGVAYLDANNNSFYDEGEGLGGVIVTVTGGASYAVTAAAGGYAFPTASGGSVTVTASGTNLPADVLTAITLTSANQKVDIRVPFADGDGDGLPDYWEGRYPAAAIPDEDTDNDTFLNSEEFRGGSSPIDAGSLPAPPPPPPPPPPSGGGGDDGDSGGGCGATGWEAVALVLLVSAARRRV